MENSNGIVTREKIDQMAVWLSSTVTSAFFNSLERFSCVNVATEDSDDDDDEDHPNDTAKPRNDNPRNDAA